MVLKSKLNIKDMPFSSRPREKLETNGRSHLSDVELLAILLGSGSAKHTVLQLSQNLLEKIPLEHFDSVTRKQLMQFLGIGISKASTILAAIELGERIFAPAALTKVLVRSTEDALEQLKEYTQKRQEYLNVLYLNARHELLQKEVIGIGSLNAMVITPKEIYSPALSIPCSSIIVSHNHPSGDPDPSDDDITFTRRIHEAGEILGITLLDHLVLAKTSYFSFKENKKLAYLRK